MTECECIRLTNEALTRGGFQHMVRTSLDIRTGQEMIVSKTPSWRQEAARLGFDIVDESVPMTAEMWDRVIETLEHKKSPGIAHRLRVIARDLRDIGNALEGDGSTVLKAALREHSSELVEVADWLTPAIPETQQ